MLWRYRWKLFWGEDWSWQWFCDRLSTWGHAHYGYVTLSFIRPLIHSNKRPYVFSLFCISARSVARFWRKGLFASLANKQPWTYSTRRLHIGSCAKCLVVSLKIYVWGFAIFLLHISTHRIQQKVVGFSYNWYGRRKRSCLNENCRCLTSSAIPCYW